MKVRFLQFGAAAVLAGLPGAAWAGNDCPDGYVCASNPDGVVASLQAQGFKAKLSKGDDGRPEIDSAASGFNFTLFFKDCDGAVKCTALEFSTTFTKAPEYSLAYVNEWNDAHRFSTMSLLKDGGILVTYDLSTAGGLDQPNFSDVVDTWNQTLGAAETFYNAHKAKAEGAKPAA